jgi:phage-related protein
MGPNIGTAYFKLAPSMQGVQGKIASGLKGEGTKAGNQLAGELNASGGPMQGAMGKLGNIAKTGGKIIAAGIAAGAIGMGALVGKMVQSQAELEQQLGGAEAVFGEYADGIKAKAESAYKTAGLSQSEFLAGANKMGSLYQGAGVSVKDSMQMSADAMQRASDVASIMGIDTTTALESVAGMAKGNYTMMDNLGVAMNDTALNAYAASKGIGKTTQQMSAGEKAGLAYQMFMEKTSKYAGNYAKENETFAGSLNTTKKAFDNLMSGSGSIDGFIDSLINTIEIAVPQIVAMLPKIVSGISAVIQAIGPAIGSALPTLVPAIVSAAVALFQEVVKLLPTVVKVLVDALPQFINGFIQIFLGIVAALPQIIDVLVKAIPTVIDALVNGLTNPTSLTAIIMGAIQLFLAILKAIPVIVGALIKAVPTIVENIIKTLTSPKFIAGLAGAGVQLIKGLIGGTLSMIGSVGGAIGRIIGIIGSTLSPGNLARIGGDLVKGLWNGISDLTGWVVGKIKGFGDSIMSGIKSFFGIHSPSTEWEWIGKMDVLGMAKGFTKNSGAVTKAVTNMANDAMAAMSPLDTSLAAGFNSSVTTAQTVAIGGLEPAAKVIQYNTFEQVSDGVDVKKISSDLAYAVSQA